MSDAHGVARDQLRAFIERIERLEEEKKTIADDIKDVYGEAKGMGFNTKIMKTVIGLRKKDEQERMEEEAVLDTYLHALGMIQSDLFEEEERPAPVRPARQPAMALQSPRKAAEAVSERIRINRNDDMPVVANCDVHRDTGSAMARTEASAVTDRRDDHFNHEMDREEIRDGRAVHSLPAENARKAMPETERGDVTHAGAGESPATEIAPASQGEAEAPSADSETGPSILGGEDSPGANTGGDHVTAPASAATHQAGASFKAPPATKPLRPHCRNPGDHCGGYGSTHCNSCLRAAKETEVAA